MERLLCAAASHTHEALIDLFRNAHQEASPRRRISNAGPIAFSPRPSLPRSSARSPKPLDPPRAAVRTRPTSKHCAIEDARMKQLPAHRRPYYSPTKRLAILPLRTACAWPAAETARRFLLTPASVAEWTQRRDEGGNDALLKTLTLVNTFPTFVSDIVLRLGQLAPTMGKLRGAQTLARAGLHVFASTIERIRDRGSPEQPDAEVRISADVVRRRRPRVSSLRDRITPGSSTSPASPRAPDLGSRDFR
jgi:hypothetical protein